MSQEVSSAATASLPKVFIESSSEGLQLASALQGLLSADADIMMWNAGVFGLGDGYLEALVNATQADFAVLALTPDDLVTTRKHRQHAPRDNVLFECGLFMGALGRYRTFPTFDTNAGIKVPSDLAGITCADFRGTDRGSRRRPDRRRVERPAARLAHCLASVLSRPPDRL